MDAVSPPFQLAAGLCVNAAEVDNGKKNEIKEGQDES